ncbi:caspase family protein [Pseudoalteromonas sp. MB41]|uniref:caspase family protein n=1 Tax=Pseudoalteromonas sp. MB41 TaxID=2896366 RepID=UPI001E331965|nr:caspase family protein [Pseudoalteromonas sp. MB41]MCC9659215.1 caspase family protein [Pseudoalteromonas sp. MB41]
MSQNLAILIGNTKYDELAALNCCANDVEKMRELLLATKKFSSIKVYIDKPVNLVKDELRVLAESSDGVEEIFLYFSGHGLSNSDDFFMCFSSFKESSPNTTGLSRNEAFDLIRLFKSELSVVVIDACEAGRSIIKNQATPLSYTLKSGISNFVQFSSCTENQFSLAGDHISLFTDEFIKACLNKEKGPVYYSDVESALRDAFINHPSQTPHFIRQSTSQEKFCSDALHLNDFRNSYFVVSDGDQQVASPPATEFALAKEAIESIEALIPQMAKAQEFIDSVFEHTLSASEKMSEISEFFEVRTVKYDDFELVQNKRSVIDLLSRRSGSDSLVESDIERIKRRNPFGISSAVLSAFVTEDEYDTKYNIWNHSKLKSVHVGIYFEPKSMALNRIFSEIVFLPRLTECLILTCNSYEKRANWDSFNEFEGTKKWKWSHHSWFDEPADISEAYVSDPYDFAKKYLISFSGSKN